MEVPSGSDVWGRWSLHSLNGHEKQIPSKPLWGAEQYSKRSEWDDGLMADVRGCQRLMSPLEDQMLACKSNQKVHLGWTSHTLFWTELETHFSPLVSSFLDSMLLLTGFFFSSSYDTELGCHILSQ